jgi:hypothetical protein
MPRFQLGSQSSTNLALQSTFPSGPLPPVQFFQWSSAQSGLPVQQPMAPCKPAPLKNFPPRLPRRVPASLPIQSSTIILCLQSSTIRACLDSSSIRVGPQSSTNRNPPAQQPLQVPVGYIPLPWEVAGPPNPLMAPCKPAPLTFFLPASHVEFPQTSQSSPAPSYCASSPAPSERASIPAPSEWSAQSGLPVQQQPKSSGPENVTSPVRTSKQRSDF